MHVMKCRCLCPYSQFFESLQSCFSGSLSSQRYGWCGYPAPNILTVMSRMNLLVIVVFIQKQEVFEKNPLDSQSRGEKMTVYPITSLGKQTLTYLYSLVVLQLVLNMRYRHYVWNSLGLLNLQPNILDTWIQNHTLVQNILYSTLYGKMKNTSFSESILKNSCQIF